jgi:hypothetical protein
MMSNALISELVFPKSLYDEIQDLHPKTLQVACVFVIAGKGRNLDVKFEKRVIYGMCDDLTPLHLT